MIKILGIGDIIAAILLFLIALSINLPQKLITIFMVYLIIKAVVFFMSWISLVDLAASILFFLSTYFILPKTLLIIIAILLLQKGIFSLF